MPIPQIVYDLDGTLVDSLMQSVEGTLAFAETQGWPADDAAKKHLIRTLGCPTETVIPPSWRGLATVQRLESFWREMNLTLSCPLYPYAREVLEEMAESDAVQHLFTARNRQSALKLIGENGIRAFFSRVITRDDTRAYKPDPHGLELIIRPYERIGLSRRDFLLVGDGAVSDWECALSAGVEFLAVAQAENAARETFLEAGVPETHIIARIADLPSWLAKRF